MVTVTLTLAEAQHLAWLTNYSNDPLDRVLRPKLLAAIAAAADPKPSE